MSQHMRPRRRRAPAQALVEFALASTLIFFLLAAAVDLGLIYFTLQGLSAAAQEGATFGSYPVSVYTSGGRDVFNPSNPAGMTFKKIDLNYPEIINRVYSSGGTGRPSGFANFRDLNNNGQDDLTENLHSDYSTANAWIRIESLYSRSGVPQPGQTVPPCPGDRRGLGMQDGGRDCYIRVTVSYNYRFLFPLVPAFANTVRLRSSQIMPVRSTFYTY
ncbi:MAG: TadE family protein [Oscillochloridaceae bacterium umkhey_bin13]